MLKDKILKNQREFKIEHNQCHAESQCLHFCVPSFMNHLIAQTKDSQRREVTQRTFS